MFSRMDSSGTTKMAEPRVEAISEKVYVWLPTVAENGGAENSGKPGFTSPETYSLILSKSRRKTVPVEIHIGVTLLSSKH